MNFYRLTYVTTDTNVKTEWFSSENNAVKRRLYLFKGNKLCGPKKEHVIEIHDIPTRKPELLEWLNSGVL